MSTPLADAEEFLSRFKGQNFEGQRLAPRVTPQAPDNSMLQALNSRLDNIRGKSASYTAQHGANVAAERARQEAERRAQEEEERRKREEQDRQRLEDLVRETQNREYDFDFDSSSANRDNALALIEATGVEGPRLQVLQMAADMIGTPYAWGGGGIGVRKSRGTGKGTQNVIGVDCSGLTSYVYGQVGIKLPRYSNHQTSVGVKTHINNAKPGDLVGWGRGGHVAVYAGNGYIIESPRPGKSVHLRKIGTNEKVFAVQLSFKG